MILGNPDKFAIISEDVESWNDDKNFFHNGILTICVDGELFPKELVSATLSCEIDPLRDKLLSIPENQELYNMEKYEAFIRIYEITFPDDINVDNDYRYNLSPYSLSDNGYYLFAVRYKSNTRILAAKLEYNIEESTHYLDDIEISETIIDNKEIQNIAVQLKI